MSKLLDIGGRIWNGIIAVCVVNALLFGVLFAIYLLTKLDPGWSFIFGTLFVVVFALGVMHRD